VLMLAMGKKDPYVLAVGSGSHRNRSLIGAGCENNFLKWNTTRGHCIARASGGSSLQAYFKRRSDARKSTSGTNMALAPAVAGLQAMRQ
jgi:hypothetical protein